LLLLWQVAFAFWRAKRWPRRETGVVDHDAVYMRVHTRLAQLFHYSCVTHFLEPVTWRVYARTHVCVRMCACACVRMLARAPCARRARAAAQQAPGHRLVCILKCALQCATRTNGLSEHAVLELGDLKVTPFSWQARCVHSA
jgi:hypothetical protein